MDKTINLNRLSDALCDDGWYAIAIRVHYPELRAEKYKDISEIDKMVEYLIKYTSMNEIEVRMLLEKCMDWKRSKI